MTVDLSDYYCGGYFLVLAKETWYGEVYNDSLLPKLLLSIGQCVGYRLQLTCGSVNSDVEAGIDFGISDTKLDEYIAWCDARYDSETARWGLFSTVSTARHFIQQFVSEILDEHYLIGIGLHRDINLIAYPPDEPQYIGNVKPQIDRHVRLEPGGTILGYEVVSYGYGDLEHPAFLCNGLHRDMHELYGFVPNQYGFIDHYDDALKLHNWIALDEMSGKHTEPEPYYPWLLVSYPLTDQANTPAAN